MVEYPIGDDLYALTGAEQAARIGQLVESMDVDSGEDVTERFASEYGPSDPQGLAFYELGQCPGSKVGGKPGFQREGRQFYNFGEISLKNRASWMRYEMDKLRDRVLKVKDVTPPEPPRPRPWWQFWGS